MCIFFIKKLKTMYPEYQKIAQIFKKYLGAKDITSLDLVCFEDVTYILLKAVYEQNTHLYPNQLIQYSLKFETDFNNIILLNPTETEQWDMKTNEPVNWSSWWPDELVNKSMKEELLLAILEYYYSG